MNEFLEEETGEQNKASALFLVFPVSSPLKISPSRRWFNTGCNWMERTTFLPGDTPLLLRWCMRARLGPSFYSQVSIAPTCSGVFMLPVRHEEAPATESVKSRGIWDVELSCQAGLQSKRRNSKQKENKTARTIKKHRWCTVLSVLYKAEETSYF